MYSLIRFRFAVSVLGMPRWISDGRHAEANLLPAISMWRYRTLNGSDTQLSSFWI